MSNLQFLLSMFGSQSPALFWGIVLAMLIFGLLSLFAGYRLLKLMLFLLGFAAGTIVASYFLDGLMATLVGLVAGVVCVILWYLGIFLMGAVLGALVAVMLGIGVPMVIGIFAVIGGVLAIIIRKFLIIVDTSYNGAAILVSLVGVFATNMSEQVSLIATLVLMTIGIIVQYATTKSAPAVVTPAAAPATAAPAATATPAVTAAPAAPAASSAS